MSSVPTDLSRRGVLTGAAAATGALLLPSTARADVTCLDTFQGKVCEAGIRSELIHVAAVEEDQKKSQWCWAACIAMIFKYHGHPVSQETIVQQAYGGLLDMAGQPGTILGSLNRSWTDTNGRSFTSRAMAGASDPSQLAWELAANKPIIVGTLGHAMVMTSLQYAAPWIRNMYGQPVGIGPTGVTLAKVRDPWPLTPSRRELNAQEWYSINFIARVEVS